MKILKKKTWNGVELIFENIIQENFLEITEDWNYIVNCHLEAYAALITH